MDEFRAPDWNETIDTEACTVHYGWQVESLPPAVKAWPSKAEFWAEFTDAEKASIITSNSTRFSLTGGQVGCMRNTSQPRIF